jgi:hypothetical protein
MIRTPRRCPYPVDRFPVRRWVEELIQSPVPLEDLHLAGLTNGLEDAPGGEQDTAVHRRFYQGATALIPHLRLLAAFLVDLYQPAGIPWLFQRIPTLRVQPPGFKAVGGEVHRDRDYGHPDGELNVIVPVTDMTGSATLFLESEPDKDDFHFQHIPYGWVLFFDGRNCRHGNLRNLSARTRVSFDFRLIAKADYNEAWQGQTIVSGKRFVVGDYYEDLSSAGGR